METVHILAFGNRLDYLRLADVFRKRQLDKDSVHAVVSVEFGYLVEKNLLRSILRQTYGGVLNAYGLAGESFVLDVSLAARVRSYEDDYKMRYAAVFFRECRHLLFHFGLEPDGKFFTVDNHFYGVFLRFRANEAFDSAKIANIIRKIRTFARQTASKQFPIVMRDLFLTNTLTRKKEKFVPINEGRAGMYVCGPTVYGDAHLGHARPGVTYDVLQKLLRHLGYKVRYVRNITDVGHLEHDADEGEDKIAKKARLEQLEPMEVVQTYTLRYHEAMRQLNVAPPSIEPRASGHIIEQIETVKKILDAGYAYESNGSIYFDVKKYNEAHHYGVLSGRNLDDTLEGTRALDGQSDKRAPYDFALWKKAEPQHIMKWPSPWGPGFPGWHLECSVMGEKYLGNEFDIHGGGMDLMFPHHECEIAQNVACRGTQGVHYWVHNNMITINGQKMGKSLGNFITLPQLFAGDHDKLEQAYSPMTVRFFILQAHYRSTLDFSNEALQAAEKGLRRVMQAYKDLCALSGHKAISLPYGEYIEATAPETCTADNAEVKAIFDGVYEALCDDMNTPVAIAHIFDAVRLINSAKAGQLKLSSADYEVLVSLFDDIVFGVLGLVDESASSESGKDIIGGLMEMVLEDRAAAKAAKDWTRSDAIRDHLKALGITVNDGKNGAEWTIE